MIDAAELRKLCLSFRGLAETSFGAKTSVLRSVTTSTSPGSRGAMTIVIVLALVARRARFAG
jgi:hypothetical protein